MGNWHRPYQTAIIIKKFRSVLDLGSNLIEITILSLTFIHNFFSNYMLSKFCGSWNIPLNFDN